MKDQKQSSTQDHEQRGSGCSHYDEHDFTRYVSGAMTSLEVERLEANTEDCDECLKILYHCHVEKEKRKNEEFTKRTMTLLDKLDKAPTANLLELVIKATGKLLELVSTTGELLYAPMLVPARGGSTTEEKTVLIRILREFSTPPLSLQATVEYCHDEGYLCLKISLFDRVTEEFMPDIGIELTGAEIREKMMTDENGEVIFRIEKQGDYKVKFTSVGDLIGKISLILEK
jgi:hypothetical protein